MEIANISRTGVEDSYQTTPAIALICQVLPGIGYKADWEISIYSGALRIKTYLPDPFNPGQRTETNHCFTIPEAEIAKGGTEVALRFIFEAIRAVERHESREFFTVDGRKYWPPPHGFAPFEEMYG